MGYHFIRPGRISYDRWQGRQPLGLKGTLLVHLILIVGLGLAILVR